MTHRKSSVAPLAALAVALGSFAHAERVELLNVSYDPTRELYQEFNRRFALRALRRPSTSRTEENTR